MAARLIDVRMACKVLAERGLEECRLESAPAYITWQDTGVAIITCGPEAEVKLNSFGEPEYLPVPVCEPTPEVKDSYAFAAMPPPGLEVSSARSLVDFRKPAACSAPALDRWVCGLPLLSEQREYWCSGSSFAPASWDWRTGQIIPAMRSHAATGADFRTDNEVHVSAIKQVLSQKGSSTLKREPRRRHSQLQLASSLCAIADENPDCVIYARQVQKLGFESADLLREHFSLYGQVKEVYLSNAHEKIGKPKFAVRVRPSGIAWIVMSELESAAAIFEAGEEHLIEGVTIRVRRFEPRDRPQDCKPGADNDNNRSRSHTASTTSCAQGGSDAEIDAKSETPSTSVDSEVCDLDANSTASSN